MKKAKLLKKINSVQLQRELRDESFRKNQGKSLAEEVASVQKNLKKKGLDRLF